MDIIKSTRMMSRHSSGHRDTSQLSNTYDYALGTMGDNLTAINPPLSTTKPKAAIPAAATTNSASFNIKQKSSFPNRQSNIKESKAIKGGVSTQVLTINLRSKGGGSGSNGSNGFNRSVIINKLKQK